MNESFKLAIITNEKTVILCKNITAKCVLIEIVVEENSVSNNIMYLTTSITENDINENEHD